MRMNYSFTKFVQNGNEYYFAAAWKDKFGDVELNLFHDGSCYNCSVNVKDFESLSSHVKLEFNEFWEQSLSMWTNNSLERKDLEVKHDDPYHTTFVWKKVLPNNPIKQRMGSMKLKKNADKGNIFFNCLVNMFYQQKQTLETLNLEQKILLKSHNDLLKKLQELSNIKEDIEKKLFSKFVQVLKQKKNKIKYFKAELDEREFDPLHPKDNASTRKRKQITNLVAKKKKVSSESGDYCSSISNKTSEDERSETDDKKSNAGSVSTADDEDIPNNICLEEILTLDVQANKSDVCSDMESDTSEQLILKHESRLATSVKNEDVDLEETQEFIEENVAGSQNMESELVDNLEDSQAKTQPIADKFDALPSNDGLGSTQGIPNSRNLGFEKTNKAGPVCDALQYLDDLI